MAGNSQRRGAVRKGGKKATVGSGGQRRRGLEGKGPTPKAVDREYHPAHKRAKSTAKRASASGSHRAAGAGRSQRRAKGSSEIVAGCVFSPAKEIDDAQNVMTKGAIVRPILAAVSWGLTIYSKRTGTEPCGPPVAISIVRVRSCMMRPS